jgi:hypothetical protein
VQHQFLEAIEASMFRLGSFKGAYNGFKKFIFTHCEEEAEAEADNDYDDYNTPSIIEQVLSSLLHFRTVLFLMSSLSVAPG